MSDLPALNAALDDEGRFYAHALRYLDGVASTEEEEALRGHL